MALLRPGRVPLRAVDRGDGAAEEVRAGRRAAGGGSAGRQMGQLAMKRL
jgi:hypothetical protein